MFYPHSLSQFDVATFQVPNWHMWPMAMSLDSAAIIFKEIKYLNINAASSVKMANPCRFHDDTWHTIVQIYMWPW